MDFSKQDSFGMDGVQKNGVGANGEAIGVEERVPLKKDISLREFLSKMDDYAPIVSPNLFVQENIYSSRGAGNWMSSHQSFDYLRTSYLQSPYLKSPISISLYLSTFVHSR